MTLLGKHGSLNKFFKKTKKWGGRMFHKVKGGLAKVRAIVDNPLVHAGASALGLGDLHNKAVGVLDTADDMVKRAGRIGDKVVHIGNKVGGLASTLHHHGQRAHEGARGLAHDHSETALNQYSHDLAHMAHDSLQKAKEVKKAVMDIKPEITYH